MRQATRRNERRIAAIPHTINAIGDALSGAQRALFYSEVLAAEEDDVPGVMRRWWKTAMLDRAPGAEDSRANAAAGRRLLSVDDLADRLEGNRSVSDRPRRGWTV
ncbi:hypothetical protein [Streptomyces sp. BRA346]|uniref:hypothetical protein n=1 Tax=Streptomyces sp. BRA346 TaxID=2878199 RepID=UPI004063917E